MRRMSTSDGPMSARKASAPSSARRLSRPSAYGACDATTRERDAGTGRRGDGATTTRPGMDARVRVCFHVHRHRSIARVVDETDRAVVDEDATGAPGRARGGRNAPAEGETIDD